MKVKSFFSFVLMMWGLVACAGENGDELAKMILEKAGIHATLCELPRAGDGALVAALVRQGVAQVHSLAPDATSVEAARKPSVADGLLGSRVVIETGAPAQLPLGDWVADLLVVADATDANLKELPAVEGARVLAPYRGVAVVGNPSGAKAGLSKSELTAWAQGTGGNVSIQEDRSGLWAVIKMPALAGGNDWTHLMHAADGNLVSEDTAFGKPPYALQWSNMPYYAGQWDIHVISAGRLFTAKCSEDEVEPAELMAKNWYNGDVLWSRPLPRHSGESTSLLIATPDKVFLKDNNGVLVLNPETGEQLGRITATENPEKSCLWMLQSDGVLLVLVGPVQKLEKLHGNFAVIQDAFNTQFEAEELQAWDTETGKQLWRFQEEKIDPNKTVASNGRVYLYAKWSYAACLDLSTGKQIWKTEEPIAAPIGHDMGNIAGGAGVFKEWACERDAAMVVHDVYFINYSPHHQCQAFSATDGHLLWDKLHGPIKGGDYGKNMSQYFSAKMFHYPLIIGSTIVDGGGWQTFKSTDLMKGANGQTNGFKIWGCARFTGTSSGLLVGSSGEVFDLNTHKQLTWFNTKAPCGIGCMVADGLFLKSAGGCTSCGEWRGFYACRSVSQRVPRANISLEKGVAGDPTKITLTADDWPTYRSDVTRKGSSPATVPTESEIRWVYQTPVATSLPVNIVGNDKVGAALVIAPAQPIAVDEWVWIGAADGAVICLDRKTGSERWRYWTAGRIFSSPTWWQGRLYIGSADGWVYCLNAETGGLLWRYQVAPEERRVMIWGRLSSAWPVMANVLVQEGEAYAVGGLIGPAGGVLVCALDAKTGEPRWKKLLDQNAITSAQRPHFMREGVGQNIKNEEKVDISAPGCAPSALYSALRMGTGPASVYIFSELTPNEAYTIRLHFVEPWETTADKRVMDIAVNGKPGLTDFDIFAESGARNKAIVRELSATADQQGKLAIQLTLKKNSTLISGIEIWNGKTPIARVQTGGSGLAEAGFTYDVDLAPQPPATPSGMGHLAWYQGKIWWHAGESGLFVVDPATGDIKDLKLNSWMMALGKGQDIGITPNGWVLFGGRQFNLPPESIEQDRNNSFFLRAKPADVLRNEKGSPSFFFALPCAHEFDSVPVWDEAEMLLSGSRSRKSQSRPSLFGFQDLDELLLKVVPDNADPRGRKFATDILPPQQRQLLPAESRQSFFCPVLARNAVVFLSRGEKNWIVAAASRTEQKILWQVDLPSLPVLGGLSVTRGGDVLAPLANGQVLCIGKKD